VVRGDGKNRHFAETSKFGDVRCFAIQNGPVDAGVDGGARDLRHGGAADRFEDDGIGEGLAVALNMSRIIGSCFLASWLQKFASLLSEKEKGPGPGPFWLENLQCLKPG